MYEISTLCQALSVYFEDSSPQEPELLCALVATYDKACHTLNDSLQACDLLLSRGQRSEAVRRCRLEQLLERASELDRWNVAQWERLTARYRRYQLEMPENVCREAVGRLRVASADELVIAPLLDQLRLYALTDASLAMKIPVMRKIREQEPYHPVAMDDLPVFESEYFDDLDGQMHTAAQADDRPTFLRVYDQFTREPWSIPLPNDKTAWIEATYRSFQTRWALQRLAELEAELSKAFSEWDRERGLVLREEWNPLFTEYADQLDATILARAKPALAWLEQFDSQTAHQYAAQQTLHHFEQLIQTPPTAFSTLEQAYQAVLRYGESLTPEQKERYHRFQLESQTMASRRAWRRLVVWMFLCIAAGVGTGWGLWQQRLSIAWDRQTSQIHTLLSEYRFAEAERSLRMWCSQHPRWATKARQEHLQSQIEQARQADRERASQFTQKMKLLRTQPTESLFEETNALARTDAEKLTLAELWTELTAQRQQRQRTVDMAFINRVQIFSERLRTLEMEYEKRHNQETDSETMSESETEALRRSFESLDQEIQAFEMEINQSDPPINSSLRMSLTVIRNRIATFCQSPSLAVEAVPADPSFR